MDKRNKNISADYKQALKSEIKKRIFKDFFSNTNNFLFGIFSAILSGFLTPYFLWKFENIIMPNTGILLISVSLAVLAGTIIYFLFYTILQIVYIIPMDLYTSEKQKAEKLTWNNIEVKLSEINENGFINAYRIKLINRKAEKCSFTVFYNYLEIDDNCAYYNNTDNPYALPWINTDNYNRSNGIEIRSMDYAEWDLFTYSKKSKNNHQICYCEFKENETTRPEIHHINFSDNAQGEIKIKATYIHTPIGTGRCGSSKSYKEEIPGEKTYKFTIYFDKNENKPQLTFESGLLSYHKKPTKQ